STSGRWAQTTAKLPSCFIFSPFTPHRARPQAVGSSRQPHNFSEHELGGNFCQTHIAYSVQYARRSWPDIPGTCAGYTGVLLAYRSPCIKAVGNTHILS